MITRPGYWMYESSGVLRPAVIAYLEGQPLTVEHIGALRAYFRQWINAPTWQGPEIETLRAGVNHLNSRRAIRDWLDRADTEGVDPI